MAMAHDLLVISDLHLGEGYAAKTPHVLRLEQELCAFLEHHRDDGRRWRLVINGDMIDLVGMTLMPAEAGLVTGIHPDDHHYGLGARAHVAALKIERVIRHHAEVFRALGRFVAQGHSLEIVVGNHDVELHWPEVQRVLSDGVGRMALEAGAEHTHLAGAITFHGWFFLEEGLAWIEHGHQYDPYCSFEDALEPATDTEEADPNIGALLLRYLGPQMADDINGAYNYTFVGYLQFFVAQGRSRLVGILAAYFGVIRRMVEHWWARGPERIAARRARARGRLREIARRLRLDEDRLVQLAALAKPPVSVDLLRIVRALMVDRLVLLLLVPLVVALMLVLPWPWMPLAVAVAAVPVAWSAWHAVTAREPVDPSETMRRIARRIRTIARVPIVVMGHSHSACAEGDADGEGAGAYFNTGTWVAHDPEQSFTHLRIERTERGVRALLCQWRDGASRAYERAGAVAFATVHHRPEHHRPEHHRREHHRADPRRS
jgi:UDP-2,3-diacylglucosamine pyrophosphatase LpxH